MATHKPRKVPKGFKVKMGRPKEWTLQEIDQLRVALDKWAKNPKNYYLSNFHIENDLHPEQMERFSNYSPAFAATLRKAKDAMTAHLVKMAVDETGNPGFIKFILQNKAGWKEKQELSGDAQNPIALLMQEVDGKTKDLLEDFDNE